MTRVKAVLAALSLATVVTLPEPLGAGSFNFVADCDEMLGCFAGFPESNPNETVPPFAITHPLGYEREGGKIEIPVCVSPNDPSLIVPTQRAIDTWNALTATTQNCLGCKVWEEPPTPAGEPFHAESVILHELGHCAMGLDHINRRYDEDDDGSHEPTSFTRSYDASAHGLDIGPDGIRGSFDDKHFSLSPGGIADSVSWFRRSDNNPVIVDETAIDIDTYSRSVGFNLPSGHRWAANGNRVVAESLGEPVTQAVMYSLIEPGQQYSGLSADEVNMVKMGMTGEDLIGGTPDDYIVELAYVEDCAANPSAIRVRFFEFDPDDPDAARCVGLGVDYALPPPFPPAGPTHFELVRLMINFAQVRLDSELCWDTGPPLSPIVFMDGFESGDLSEWDKTVPITASPRGRAALASWWQRGQQAASTQPTQTRQDAARPGENPGSDRARRAGADARSSGQLAGTCPPSVTEGP